MHTDPVPDAALTDTAAIARSLDCFTEAEICRLAKIAPATAEAWRKRGTGPAYIRFGNAFLYPREALASFLKTSVRQRAGRVSAASIL